MNYVIGIICVISICLMIYSRKKEKRAIIKKLKMTNYSICIFLVINTVIESVFRQTYIEHYMIFRIVDNILFGIVLLTGLLGIWINLSEIINKKKTK